MMSSLFLIGSLAFVLPQSLAQTNQAQPVQSKPSDQFKADHAEIHKHLDQVDQWVQGLSDKKKSEQKKVMAQVAGALEQHIKPHAEWEEKKLYPAVDARASQGPEAFTSSMRYEHRIVGRWIEDLRKQANSDNPNPKEFARVANRLLGLIDAHFEEEEKVLLPILDRSMTTEQFKKEILSDGK